MIRAHTIEPLNMSYLKTTLVTLFALSLGVLLSSCDSFLEEQPKGSLGGEVVENEKGVQTLLIGAYSALSATETTGGASAGIAGGDAWMSDPSHWPYGAVASDVAQKGSIPNDQVEVNDIMRHSWGATNSYFDGLWSNRFEGVVRANNVLQTLANTQDISESEATRIRGEARFLRAYFYFDLKKNFDNVPWISDTTENVNQPNNVEEEVIWPKIEQDLEFAMNNLDDTAPDQGRANKWAAEAFLAKAHLYQEEWDEAKEHFDNVIANGTTPTGVPYALEERYSDNFNAAEQDGDNSEIIFSVEMTGDDGSGEIANSWTGYKLNYPHGVSPFRCCGFFLASHDLVNSYKTTSAGLPQPADFTQSFNGMDAVLKSDQGVGADAQFTPAANASLDPRLDWTVGRRGVPYHDHGPHPGNRYIRGSSSYAGPYSAKKHIWRRANSSIANNSNSWAPGTGVDYPAMRFADVLLMAAEAELEASNGSMQQALDYVNDVRERAAGDLISGGNGFVNNSMNEAFALAVVDSEADMLDTNPSDFDWVVRTDEDATYMFLGGDSGDISNWNKYPNPADNYNIEPYTMGEFTSGVGAERKIHFERKLELAMEGHRYYDLVRWGRAESRMNAYFQYQGNVSGDVETSDNFQCGVFPIPQEQIDISNGQLTQNPQCNY